MGIIALIPARSGSKRIPLKNIRRFFMHPLVAYAIQAARDAGIFEHIYVSSDAIKIGVIADHYGAEFIHCPPEYAHNDMDGDIKWILHAFSKISISDFMILRPTSPFRTAETIIRAYKSWDHESCMKAVEPARQHPYKMWSVENAAEKIGYKRMISFSDHFEHLLPIQLLPAFYTQNGCIEIRPGCAANGKDIYYQPFFTKDNEGFDLNTYNDWLLAEELVKNGMAKPVEIRRKAYGNHIKRS